MTGGMPSVIRPIEKMKRFTAYDSRDSPMMTWKVRGRSSSHTPEPASTPMARESINSMSVLLLGGVDAFGRRLCQRLAVEPQRLVGEGNEHQYRCADHQHVDADVEQQNGRQMHGSDQRDM